MKTIGEHVSDLKDEFRKLSQSHKRKLASDAIKYIRQNPGCADNNGFWRGLSANHVLSVAYEKD
jgi:hypothetical protein